jgi:DNA topoisomerase-3
LSILVVSEKPSVSASIAAVLNAKERWDGFFHGNGYVVTWAVGHLLELAAPESYDGKYAKWRCADLPIIPAEWKHMAVAKTAKQLKIICDLMNQDDVEAVINGCDAGREGEHIFRLIYEHAHCKKPVKRLWISSLEDTAIRAGFDKLKGGAEYDSLYASALCRSRADWLIDLNMTRTFSTVYNATLTVGRVQSPTLAMITAREADIAAFVKEPFYFAELSCASIMAAGEKSKDKASVEAIITACDGKPAIVTAIDRQQKSAAPPKLYDLTTLQREANRIFAFTARQTLDAAQSLYERKLATYPRTDARYLTDDMAAGLPALVSTAASAFGLSAGSVNAGQVINAAKVSDHHAILPTMSIGKADLSALPKVERDILNMLAARLICAVGDKHVYEAAAVTLDCGGYSFTAKGKTVLSDGWKAVDTAFRASLKGKPGNEDGETAEDGGGEEGGALPELSKGQTVDSAAVCLREGFTAPPKHFTEDSLLSAMENAGVDDAPENVER